MGSLFIVKEKKSSSLSFDQHNNSVLLNGIPLCVRYVQFPNVISHILQVAINFPIPSLFHKY